MKLWQQLLANWSSLVFRERVVDLTPKIRMFRLIEEIFELAQTENVTKREIDIIKHQVYSKPKGERFQELGGVGTCLMAYCHTAGMDFEYALQCEFMRMSDPTVMEKVRTRNLAGDKLGLNGPSTRIRKVCQECGSTEVVKDAWAEWDEETQEWVLQNVFDMGYCQNCESSSNGGLNIEDQEITPESETPAS